MKTNNPPITVELDAAMVDFIIDNCEANMRFALGVLQNRSLPRAALEKIVDQNEKFKQLRELVLKAQQS